MFNCNRVETSRLMDGQATGVARVYDECPHVVGGEIVLTSKFLDDSGRSIPFAKATIVSVRPGTFGEFRHDSMIPEMDGYANGEEWAGHMRRWYPAIGDSVKMFHLKLRVFEMDKEAGQRGDVD